MMNFYERFSSNLKTHRYIELLENYDDELSTDVDRFAKGHTTENEIKRKWNSIFEIMSNYEIKVGYLKDIDSSLGNLISSALFTYDNLRLTITYDCKNRTTSLEQEQLDSINTKMKRYRIEQVYLDLDEIKVIEDSESDYPVMLKQIMTFTIYTKDSLLKTYPFMSNKMDNFQEYFREEAPGFNFLIGKRNVEHDKFREFWMARFGIIGQPLTFKYGKSTEIKKCCLDYYFDE